MLPILQTVRRAVPLWRVAALCGLLAFCAQAVVRADTAGDRKRAQLAEVKRIAVVPPFFGTDTLTRAAGKPGEKGTAKPERPAAYLEQLRQLEAYAARRLPERVAARTPFRVVPAEELAAALKDLNLTPASLFQNDGRLHGGHFSLPDADAVRKLAARLHADAVLLGTMDEPRRDGGKYYIDTFGLNYENAHVRSKAGYFVLLADGTEVLHDYVEALHPLTPGKGDRYLLVDWKEATGQVIEDLMDEMTRYTPEKIARP